MTRREQLDRLYDSVGEELRSRSYDRVAANRWKRRREGFDQVIEVSENHGRYTLTWSATEQEAADIWWGPQPGRNDASTAWGLAAGDVNTALWPSRQPEVTDAVLATDALADLVPTTRALCERLEPIGSLADLRRLVLAGPENDSVPFVHPTSRNGCRMLAALLAPETEQGSDRTDAFLEAAAALRDAAAEPWAGRLRRHRARVGSAR